MKNVFLLTAMALFATSCVSCTNTSAADRDEVRTQYEQAKQQLNETTIQLQARQQELVTLTENINVTKNTIAGKTPVYIVGLRLRQISYSLNIQKQLRDLVNEVYFELPVSPEYYKQLSIGDNINDDFRLGSLIFHGTFGQWQVKVKDKRIEYITN